MPGGGNRELWTDHEGHRVAAWLSAHGVSAFVLKYRLAREEGSRYTVEDHALADARRALRTVRQRAAEWRVDPQRLGVMGFSAGGDSPRGGCAAGRAATRRIPSSGRARSPRSGAGYPGTPRTSFRRRSRRPRFCCAAPTTSPTSRGLASVYLRFKQAGVPAGFTLFGSRPRLGLRAATPGLWPAGWTSPRVDGQARLRKK
jgi:endo-1,4-beta-xylanase